MRSTKAISKKSNRKTANDSEVYVGSGNVFADIGVANPDEALAKAKLAHQICALIKSAGITQLQAAKRLGIDQPKVSALVRGRLDQFSLERLLKFINDLGRDVDLVIRSPRSEHAGLYVISR